MASFGFSISTIMSSSEFYFFLSSSDAFYFLYSLIVLVTSSSTILNRNGKSRWIRVSFCTWSEVWAEWSSLCSLLWKMDVLLFHHHLLKRLSILHSITFSPLSKIHWSCTCGSISGLCSTDSCLYPFINTTFLHYCSLEILIILALTQKLCKIDIFHVIKMSPMFIIQQLSHTENT